MLNLVKRWKFRREAENRNRAIIAFRSLVSSLTPIAYVRPKLVRVTANKPFRGRYLEDDMKLAVQPDGTPLEVYMIDGYAIDGLWLGFDKAACQKYLDTQPKTAHQLPVYRFTQPMAELATIILGRTMSAHTHLVEYRDGFLPLKERAFRRIFQRKPAAPVFVMPQRIRAPLRRVA